MKKIRLKTPKYLKMWVWACLYILLLTPLIIHPGFIFPYITFKTLFFRIIVEIALFLYILLAIQKKEFRPSWKMNKILFAILAFGVIILITGLLGVNPYKSFWSTIERGEGFLTISHLIVYCFILVHVFRNRREWYAYLTGAVIVSFFVMVYAILQSLGVGGVITNAGGSRIASTLGNAAYMGAYMLGTFWISIILFIKRKNLPWKIFFGISALLQLYYLYNSQTRGAFLAFLITLFIFLIAIVLTSQKRKVKIGFISLIIIFIILASLTYIYSDSEFIRQSTTLRRMTTINLKDITIQTRFHAWNASWRGWQDKFLFGYGWENYNVAYNKYFPPEVYLDNGSRVWFDRSHNTFFDVAVQTGFVGVLVFLYIYGASILYLFKKWLKDKSDYLPFVLALIFVGHFIQNLFVFDSISTYIMLYFVFAFVVFETSERKEITTDAKKLNPFIVIVLLLIVASAINYFNVKPAKANIAGLKGLRYLYQGQIEEGIQEFDKGINMHTYQTGELRQKVAENIIRFNNAKTTPNKENLMANFDYAIKGIEKNIEEYPLDAQNYLFAMALYNAAGQYKSSYCNNVFGLAEKALELSSTRPQIYFEMGRAALVLGRINDSYAYFQKAVDLNPTTLDSHWNILTAYIITRNFDAADIEYGKMRNLGLEENRTNLERIAALYISVKEYNRLLPIYQKLVVLDPNNENYRKTLDQLLNVQRSIPAVAGSATQIK